MSAFSDVETAIDKAQWLADVTGKPHMLIQRSVDDMTIVQQGQFFLGEVLEKFNPTKTLPVEEAQDEPVVEMTIEEAQPTGFTPQRNGHETWQPWEDEFLMEVYQLKEWSIDLIAEKLERSRDTVIVRASYCGVKRPKG